MVEHESYLEEVFSLSLDRSTATDVIFMTHRIIFKKKTSFTVKNTLAGFDVSWFGLSIRLFLNPNHKKRPHD
jgi:hypothetical protein